MGYRDKFKYFSVDGMILKDNEEEFSIEDFWIMLLDNGYHIGGEFKGFNEKDEYVEIKENKRK